MSGSHRYNTRKSWFDAGATAFLALLEAEGHTTLAQAIRDQAPDGAYPCPICLRMYLPEALISEPHMLTEEDVPPKSMGGKELVLTCLPCNGASGRIWDRVALNDRRVHNSVLGRIDKPIPVALEFQGDIVRGKLSKMQVDGAGPPIVTFTQKEKDFLDDETRSQRVRDYLTNNIDTDNEFDLTVTHTVPIDPDNVAWSFIRAAYLAAFAKWGYRYALLDVVQPVRTVLADPASAQQAPKLVARLATESVKPRFFLVLEPAELQGFASYFGDRVVFLPCWPTPREVGALEIGVTRLGGQQSLQFTHYTEFDWPTEARYAMDCELPS
jgi:hypothetical protein